MAKIDTLIDDFQDNSIDASKWATTAGVTETGGRLVLTPSTPGVAPNARSVSFYDLNLSSLNAEIPVVTSNGSSGTLQCGMGVEVDANNQLSIRKVSSSLVVTQRVAGVETNPSIVPYNSTNHRFWRIRADASNIYWETSATGSGTYFIQHTQNIAALFPVSAVKAFLYTRYDSPEAFPGSFRIEAVNPGLALRLTGASTSTGSLNILASSPQEITASGASTSTGTLALSLTSAPSLFLSLHGVSTSTGTFLFAVLSTGALTFQGLSTSTGSLALTTPIPPPVMPGGTWYFEPPIVYDLPPTLPGDPRNRLARWYNNRPRGRSVLKTGFSYVIVDTPTVDQMAAADIVYQGGHIYEISAEEAYDLQAAGFTVEHETDLLTTESGDLITTESGDFIEVEYSFGSS